MRKCAAMAVKEFRQAFRDPLSLVMLLGLPALMLLLYGYAINFDVRHVALAVQDRDRSAQSRELVAAFVRSGCFDLAADLPAGADLPRLTARRLARAILVIPERFAETLSAGRTARVQLILDGSDANTATTVLGYASAVAAGRNVALLRGRAGPGGTDPLPPIDYEPRVWYNPELLSTHFLVPGLIGFILMLTAVLSTALSVVREKERGTMEQLRLAPLGIFPLIFGKCVPYLAVSLAATGVILAAAQLLFGVTIRGPVVDLFLATVLYLVGALGFGILISTVADSQAMAFQLGTIASMLPAMILSGFVFPIRSMPEVLQWVTCAVPARYYLVVLRGIILKGAGLAPYAREMAFLGIYAAAVLALSAVRLGRRGS